MKKPHLIKTLFAALLSFSLLNTSAATLRNDDKPIETSQLPKAAQTFISKHFADRQVATASMDTGLDRDYTVIFTSGEKIEFDRKGNWTDISSRNAAVPEAFIPAPISKYVKNKFKNVKIREIERDGRGYEVKLSNGLDLKFNKKFKVTEIDD